MHQSTPVRSAPPATLVGPDRPLPETTVLGRFERCAAETPDAPAVSCGDRRLSYRELDTAAERLAAGLRGRGTGPGRATAVHLGREADLVVALLAVWKSGGVYLPLDPGLPADRIAFLLRDAQAELVLTGPEPTARQLPDEVTSATVGELSASSAGPGAAAAAQPLRPDAPAYVIYTSGSTGRPKGVRVGHRSLLNVVLELAAAMPCGPGDRWLAMAAPGFDISMAELTVPLATGAELVLTGEELPRDPRALVRLVRERGITRMQAVPSQWRLLLDAGFDAPDLVAMTGGEALTVPLARALRSRVAGLFNGYGPTETTVLSTLWRVPEQVTDISIGLPIANTRLSLVDDRLRPVAPGEAGELCIAGAGVSLGYLNRTELTADRFIAEPGGPAGALKYRTGDRCRLRPDGLLEFVGRTDDQVKIRGQRIELGEVEAGLAAMPGLAGAVAAVHDQGAEGTALAAYVVARAGAPAPSPAQVREFGRTVLPSAMVPSLVVVLDRFPLTPNGKVDRRALPAPTGAGAEPTDTDSEPTATALLTEVSEICREVLGVERVLPGDDLADLGGHSLTMMQIAGLMRARWNVDIPVELFFEYDTVAELAQAIGRIRTGADAP
ncbi:amino acid adenylation domain-containing protein [Streptacidiphilus sp. N1-3]|uniref:Amino acid adenylation domain-containing protein n=1 Tax=Streptacidiphilus alkalitolerans TaxID=3342712 RepID=A0ABV6X0B8_9ACTN